MRGQLGLEPVIEAVYDAALGDAGWTPAMAMIRQRYRSTAEAFYYLDPEAAAIRPIHRGGIEPTYVGRFAACYAAPDYPWRRAAALRKVGVVRTEARLAAVTGDRGLMRRSSYYNDWLRPQRLEHSIGITLLADRGTVANLTLLRPGDDSAFAGAELRDFARLSTHVRRALAMAHRLDLMRDDAAITLAALDRLPYGVVLVSSAARILHVNQPAELLLAARDGLRVQDGRLVAVDHREAGKLDALIAGVARASGAESVVLRRAAGRRLVLSLVGLSPRPSALGTARPSALVLLVDPDAIRPNDIDIVRRLYGLTEAETRLADALIAGTSLKAAADAAGTSYETARWHLKSLFQKTDTNRQAALVGRVLRDIAATPLV